MVATHRPIPTTFQTPRPRSSPKSLQSEEGTQFFGKLNRNTLVLDDHVEVEDDQHRWLPFNVFTS